MTEIVWKNVEDSSAQTVSPGITARQLWCGSAGERALVVELAPGAVWDGVDIHQGNSEEVFVISGVFNDGIRDYPAGTFIHHPLGTRHIPQSAVGCQLFIFYPETHC